VRVRFIKPGFFANEQLAALSPAHRLLFVGLWGLADREGRLLDRPGAIRASVFPYDVEITTAQLDAMLDDLQRLDFIVRYSYPRTALVTERAIAIPTFLLHQHPHARETPSRIQPPQSTDLGVAEAQPRSDKGDAQAQLRPDRDTGSFSNSGLISQGDTKAMPRLVQGAAEATPRLPDLTYGSYLRTTDPFQTSSERKSTAAKSAAGLSPHDDNEGNSPKSNNGESTGADAAIDAAGNLGVLTRIAHDLLAYHGDADDAGIREGIKRQCAELHLAYDAATVRKALDIARVQRRRRPKGTA